VGNFFAPIQHLFLPVIQLMGSALSAIHSVIPSYGWTLIAMAFLVRLALFPLSQAQFKSMAEMQKLQPLIKGIQAKHKGDPPRVQSEMMALYKEHKVNPLAGCLPILLQLPILIALYWAIYDKKDAFATEHFLWIGSPISFAYPHIFAINLAQTDLFLLGLYVISMYLSVRYGSPPSTDPQQAQTQKIMAFASPVMIGYFGFQYHWMSALLVYWLAINVFTMAQQFILFRRLGLVGGPKATALVESPTLARANGSPKKVAAIASGEAKSGGKANGKNGSTSKNAPSGRAYKRGAKR